METEIEAGTTAMTTIKKSSVRANFSDYPACV
jgi:hypothetical protein